MSILRLRELLKEKGMSGKELAEKVEVTQASISNIVQGNSFPKPELLLDISKALDVDIRDLFYPTKLQEYDQIKHEQLVKFINVINGDERFKIRDNQISISELTSSNEITAGISLFLNVLNIRAGSSGEYNLYRLIQAYLKDGEKRKRMNEIIR